MTNRQTPLLAALVLAAAPMILMGSEPLQFAHRNSWPQDQSVGVWFRDQNDDGANEFIVSANLANVGMDVLDRFENMAQTGVSFHRASSPDDAQLWISRQPDEVMSQFATACGSAFFGILDNNERGGNIRINSLVTDVDAFERILAHEIGHLFGLTDCASCRNSIMEVGTSTGDCSGQPNGPAGPSVCDQHFINDSYRQAYGDRSERRQDDEPPGGCLRHARFTDSVWRGLPSDPCLPMSPILISVRGNRLELTDAAAGVDFDLDADGVPERIGWTAEGSDDAFLALDRNRNGRIDDGSELFGNFTDQPPSDEPNGFAALAEFDQLENGGNGDGVISEFDLVYALLLLWIDRNHDGHSQPSELTPLADSRILALDLDYRRSQRRDRHGNEFRFISRVQIESNRDRIRRKLAIDVFFVHQ